MPGISKNLQGQLANQVEKSLWATILPATSINAATRIKQSSRYATGLFLLINVAGQSSLSLTPKIEVVDDAGHLVVIWSATSALVANGAVLYVFDRNGLADLGAGVTQKSVLPLPRDFQINLDVTAGSATVDAHVAYT